MEKIDIEKLDIEIDALTVKRADPHIVLLAEKINELIDERNAWVNGGRKDGELTPV